VAPTIDARSLLRDLRGRMPRSQLMVKYGLSHLDFTKALERITRERRNRAESIAADIRRGCSEEDLMRTFQISPKRLPQIIEALVAEGFLNGLDLQNLRGEDEEVIFLEKRRSPRYKTRTAVVVIDAENPFQKCLLIDASEQGLAVKGMDVRREERRRLAVLGDEIGSVEPFELKAQCRWIHRNADDGRPVAGFELVGISDENAILLRKLLDHLESEIVECDER
jgi:hypothetical protein